MTGDECPLPGTATFHATFSVALQRVGTFVSPECPSPRGPRQPGHSPAGAPVAHSNTVSTAISRVVMVRLLHRIGRGVDA
jgi:hypothetical protein